jgi:hypothetical protein
MSSEITEDMVRTAVNAPPLGERGYALDPAGKAGAMRTPHAGPLIRVLSDRLLGALVESYQHNDRAAEDAQKRYRRWLRISKLAHYGIILLGISALASTHLLQSWLGSTGNIMLWLGLALVVQLILLLVTLLIGLHFKRRRPIEAWMRLRGFAEAKRLAFFDCVMQRPQVAMPNELPLLPLKLEFIVRYLLEPQLDYFRKRSKQLARGSGLGTFSLIVQAVVIVYTLIQIGLTIAVTLFEMKPPMSFDPQLAMGRALIGAAFAVLLATSSIAPIDERNALRYQQTADNLDCLLRQHLPIARAAASREDHPAVDSFVRLVSEQVGFGAADWLSLDQLREIAAEAQPTRATVDTATARRFLLALRPDAEPGPRP